MDSSEQHREQSGEVFIPAPAALHNLRSSVSAQSIQNSSVNTSADADRTKSASEFTLPEGDNGENKGNFDHEKSKGEANSPPAGPPGAGYPDGGLKAWLCVFGAFWCLFVSFGWINCIGVFQDTYQTTLLSSYSPGTVAWITSLETFTTFAIGPLWGRIYDLYGPRYLLLGGTFLHVFGLMMTSISTQYYQFILAQGVCSPLGASAVFFCAISSVSTWFFHKRALAVGITAAGSSLGGVIYPIMVQNLIPKVGFPWTMRICAFLILGLLIISNLTVRSRFPPAPKPFSFAMMWKPFTEKAFGILALASFLIFFGIFIPFDFLSLQAQTVGMSAELAAYLIPILNAVSIFGRTIPGYLGDKLGRFNILTIFTAASGIFCVALWLPAKSNVPVILFAAFYGFASGAFVSMLPACIAQISPITEIGVRNGSLFAVISIAALVGNPIAGALVNQDNGNYAHLQIFAGIFLIGGSLGMLGSRTALVGFKPVIV